MITIFYTETLSNIRSLLQPYTMWAHSMITSLRQPFTTADHCYNLIQCVHMV